MTVLRAFIAIELPQSIQVYLEEIIQQLNTPPLRAVRWVSAQNIHLTLKFLGDIQSSNVDPLCKAMAGETARHPAFELSLKGLGAFPNNQRPRVIWAGINAPPDLKELHAAIEAISSRMGIPPEERRFAPHLTLGRVSPRADGGDLKAVTARLEKITGNGIQPHSNPIKVDGISLFQSELRPDGPIYTQLFHSPLHLL